MNERKLTRNLSPLPKIVKSEPLPNIKSKKSRKKSQKIKIVEGNRRNLENEEEDKEIQQNIFSISGRLHDLDKDGDSEVKSIEEISNDDQNRQLPVKPKRSKKSRSKHGPSQEVANENLTENPENREQQTSISTENQKDRRSSSIGLSGEYPQHRQSQSVGKLFVEHKNKFISVDQSDENEDSNKIKSYSPPSQLALDVAIKNQKYFCIVGTLCCGLLSGIGLWQCVIPYQSDPPEKDIHNYLNYCKRWTLPFQSLFFSLLVISTIFAFDRYDLFHLRWNTIKKSFVCQNGLVIVIIYPVTLILSLSIIDVDNKISLYEKNSSLWMSMSHQEMVDEVVYWRNVNTARCTGAVLGWIIVAILPKKDYFGEFLKRIREEDDSIPDTSRSENQWGSV
ncbi:transmembrane protein 237-like [Centruroides vittatus]|uniref:transmembrane protein 237-like n=1 Tax=Centruroides vittatus TaxID=120091 RepID=UPI00350F1BC4